MRGDVTAATGRPARTEGPGMRRAESEVVSGGGMHTRRRPLDNQEWIRACREDNDDDNEGERKEKREGETRRR